MSTTKEEPKTPPVTGADDDEVETTSTTPTKGKKGKGKATTPKKEKKETTTTPSKKDSNNNTKRKESPSTTSHTMETRTRKKAREAIDLIVGGPQRATSLVNFLGSNYDKDDYKGPSDEQLKMMFRVFDRDNDGHIGSDELAEVLRSMGKRPLTKKIQKMLDECDVGKNGTIELEEFVTFMQKKAAKKAATLRAEAKSKKEAEEREEEEEDEEAEKADKQQKANKVDKANKADKADKSNKADKAEKADKANKADKEDKAEKAEKQDTKGKGKKSPKSKKTTAKKSKKDADPDDSTPPKPKRGASIIEFYNPHAGLHAANPSAPVDKYNNPAGPEFDLGLEGAFTAYKILAGLFYDSSVDNAATVMTPADFKARIGDSLKSKGFGFEVATTQKDFIAKLADFDEAWIISNKSLDTTTTPDEFTNEVVKFHQGGGGLFLWADNAPWTAHANLITKKLFNTVLSGNSPADKTIEVGDVSKAGHFAQHLITSGIKYLFEGRTVSFPQGAVPNTLKVLATSTDNTPVILYSDNTKFAPTAGRVVIDCGFTKLWVQWDSAGNERYVKNASVWLIGIDNRIAIDVPLTGKLQQKAKVEKPVWQFRHGGWHNYDKDASEIVEAAYQDWKSNPYTDVRSVKSGVWHYMVDFRQMKQTNVEHENHTQRDIQRLVQEVYD